MKSHGVETHAIAVLGHVPLAGVTVLVALVGAAAEMASAFTTARKNRLIMSVGIALGRASQIALFVAPVLVLLSYWIDPAPMDLQFRSGAVVMIFIAILTARWSPPTGARPGSSACCR